MPTFNLYMKTRDLEGNVTLQRMPVTYTTKENAVEGVESYCRSIPDTVFWLTDNDSRYLVMIAAVIDDLIFTASFHPIPVEFLYKND